MHFVHSYAKHNHSIIAHVTNNGSGLLSTTRFGWSHFNLEPEVGLLHGKYLYTRHFYDNVQYDNAYLTLLMNLNRESG